MHRALRRCIYQLKVLGGFFSDSSFGNSHQIEELLESTWERGGALLAAVTSTLIKFDKFFLFTFNLISNFLRKVSTRAFLPVAHGIRLCALLCVILNNTFCFRSLDNTRLSFLYSYGLWTKAQSVMEEVTNLSARVDTIWEQFSRRVKRA